ncbi:MAG: hypothetical protein MZV70_43735 [Desulfobacterales bacterium]|nr:hypothetical protein [Desulfobacterales bacterium]
MRTGWSLPPSTCRAATCAARILPQPRPRFPFRRRWWKLPGRILEGYLADNCRLFRRGGRHRWRTDPERGPSRFDPGRSRSMGLKVKGDGYELGTDPEMLQDLLQAGLLDCVAMDLKAPLDQQYSQVCGIEVDLEAIEALHKRYNDLRRRLRVPHHRRAALPEAGGH